MFNDNLSATSLKSLVISVPGGSIFHKLGFGKGKRCTDPKKREENKRNEEKIFIFKMNAKLKVILSESLKP